MTTQKDVTVRMPEDLINRLDAQRGPIPRNAWIKLVAAKAIEEGLFKAPTAPGPEIGPMSVKAIEWAKLQEVDEGDFAAKFLLIMLAEAADPDGVTFIGQQKLAAICAFKRRETVAEIQQRLVKRGLIAKVPRRRDNGSKASDYIVLAPKGDRGEMIMPGEAGWKHRENDLPKVLAAIEGSRTPGVPKTESGAADVHESRTPGVPSHVRSPYVRSPGGPYPSEKSREDTSCLPSSFIHPSADPAAAELASPEERNEKERQPELPASVLTELEKLDLLPVQKWRVEARLRNGYGLKEALAVEKPRSQTPPTPPVENPPVEEPPAGEPPVEASGDTSRAIPIRDRIEHLRQKKAEADSALVAV